MQEPVTRPEFDLLLACCTAEADTGRSSRVSLSLDRGPDWVELARLAEHHSVGPIVYRSLSAFLYAVPGPVLEQLRKDYERNAQKSLRLTHELLRILDCLESRGIPAIPYKARCMFASTFRCRTIIPRQKHSVCRSRLSSCKPEWLFFGKVVLETTSVAYLLFLPVAINEGQHLKDIRISWISAGQFCLGSASIERCQRWRSVRFLHLLRIGRHESSSWRVYIVRLSRAL
jgi:hypothetical protein